MGLGLMQKRALIATAVAALTVPIIPGVASATGGNCTSSVQTKAISWSPDQYRVAAKCSSLYSDSKAQGNLLIPGDYDHYTSWFTALNTYYYSSYWGSLFGTPGSSVTIAHV